MHNFNFPEKGLGLVSPPHFVYDFSRKCFLCYILSTDQISLSDCISIVSLLGCDVIKFEIKTFRYITKKSRQKLKYLENEKIF